LNHALPDRTNLAFHAFYFAAAVAALLIKREWSQSARARHGSRLRPIRRFAFRSAAIADKGKSTVHIRLHRTGTGSRSRIIESAGTTLPIQESPFPRLGNALTHISPLKVRLAVSFSKNSRRCPNPTRQEHSEATARDRLDFLGTPSSFSISEGKILLLPLHAP
jgi:hypothetical protein